MSISKFANLCSYYVKELVFWLFLYLKVLFKGSNGTITKLIFYLFKFPIHKLFRLNYHVTTNRGRSNNVDRQVDKLDSKMF